MYTPGQDLVGGDPSSEAGVIEPKVNEGTEHERVGDLGQHGTKYVVQGLFLLPAAWE